MPETTERSPLQIALIQACEFAIAHGVEPCIEPDDFRIQHDPSGRIHATYIDNDCVVSVTITPEGAASFAVGEIWWTHDQGNEMRDPCEYCEIDEERAAEMFRGVPLVDVHLPGDAPEAVNADA